MPRCTAMEIALTRPVSACLRVQEEAKRDAEEATSIASSLADEPKAPNVSMATGVKVVAGLAVHIAAVCRVPRDQRHGEAPLPQGGQGRRAQWGGEP